MLYLVREYINYRLKAKHRHGVHSPFVYQFNDECLRLPVPKKVKNSYSEYYRKLCESNRLIAVNDFGAGSKKLTHERSVKAIAKVSGSSYKYAALLYRIVNYYKPKRALELGTSLGLGTLMMQQGNDETTIDTVEGCSNTLNATLNLFPGDCRQNISFHQSQFDSYLAQLDRSTTYDLVFIDGDHRGNSVQNMLEKLTPFIHDETIILLDDIRWSSDMTQMWEAVKASKKYHVSIDLFKIGLLVNRKHQATEHFVIRY